MALGKKTYMNQRGIGVILSYVLITTNMLMGILITPVIVGALGKQEYGLYNTIASFANALMLLDFGIGTTIARYISKCGAKSDKDGVQNVLYVMIIQCTGIAVAVFIVGLGLNALIPSIYSATLSSEEITRAQQVFRLLIINISLTMFDHYFAGVSSSHERFLFINSCKIFRLLLRVTSIIVLLQTGATAVTLAAIDLGLTVVFLLIDAVYVIVFLNTRIRICKPGKKFVAEIFVFGLTIFLQAFVNQVNSNVDKVILGIMTTTGIVAVYSVAMQIFSIFSSLSSAISGVYLPYVTKTIHSENGESKISDLIASPGRKQFMITGLALLGFVYIGRDFIKLWMGTEYLDAWLITVIIIVPSMIELVENVAVSVTLAKGKNGIRTLIISIAALFNVIVSVILVRCIGYLGAPIATALSYLFGYIIAVNIFYVKVLNIDILRVFKKIFSRTWLCFLVTAIVSIPMLLFEAYNYYLLIAKTMYICVIFTIMLFVYGFTDGERKSLQISGKRLKAKIFRSLKVYGGL